MFGSKMDRVALIRRIRGVVIRIEESHEIILSGSLFGKNPANEPRIKEMEMEIESAKVDIFIDSPVA
jgi:hypothetical protein